MNDEQLALMERMLRDLANMQRTEAERHPTKFNWKAWEALMDTVHALERAEGWLRMEQEAADA